MPFRKLMVNDKWLMVPVIAIIFFSLFSIHNSQTFAQSSPLEKADNDYAYQYGKYVELHNSYLSAKNTYSTFKTATSKNDAFQKTKEYLKQVHNVYISYLLLAKEIGNTFDWGDNAKNKNSIAKNLDSEINFFTENIKKIDRTKTLEELPPLALELDTYIADKSDTLIYRTLITYNLVEAQTNIKQLGMLATELDNYAKNKLPAEKYNSFFANWNSEIKKIQTEAQKSLDRANINIESNSKFAYSDVTAAANRTQEVQKQLQQANTLFEEVIRL